MTSIFKQVMKTLNVILAATAIVACSSSEELDGSSSSGNTNAAAAVIATSAFVEGRAVKGLVVNGVVNAYEIQTINGRGVKSDLPVTAAVRTDADGRYQIPLTGNQVGREFVVEVTADSQTQMRCELVNGCNDTEYADFGDYFTPAADFKISTLTPIVSAGRTTTAHVSLFSHLARAQSEASVTGFGQQSFIAAIENVETMLSLEPGVVFLEPIDLADAVELQSADQGLAEAGVLAAAFHEIAAGAEWDSISEVVNQAALTMAQHGSLSYANMGAMSDVALDDVFYAGQVVANEYASSGSASVNVIAMMDAVENNLSDQQQDSMDDAASITPVQIVTQPVSQVLNSGELLQLSVGVIGTGPIAYQWYKNGVIINGENTSTFLRDSADVSDTGNYTVTVSNAVGSVQSSVAMTTVNAISQDVTTQDVTLSWDIPTEREDGSALALYEIDGYVIHYGKSENDLSSQIEVIGGGVTSQIISDLETGDYYFAIATIDSENLQGNFSTTISVSVN